MVGVRGFLYRAGIALSIGTVTIGAVDQSVLNDQFNTVQIDGKADERVNVYVPLVGKTQSVVGSRFVPAKNLRILADTWIEGSRVGRLQTIVPGYYGENILDGPKGEIIRACTLLSKRLSTLSQEEYSSGQFTKSAEDAVRSMDVLNIIRFSDQRVYSLTLAFYRKPLLMLNMSLEQRPELSEQLRLRLTKTNRFQSQIMAMKQHEQNIQTQYAVRYGQRMLNIDQKAVGMYDVKELDAQVFAETPGEAEARSQALACGFAPE
jgi:hypothetical protein